MPVLLLKAMWSLWANTPRVWRVLEGRWRRSCPAFGYTSTRKGQVVMPWRIIQGSHRVSRQAQLSLSHSTGAACLGFPSPPAQILNLRIWMNSSLPGQEQHRVPAELPRALPWDRHRAPAQGKWLTAHRQTLEHHEMLPWLSPGHSPGEKSILAGWTAPSSLWAQHWRCLTWICQQRSCCTAGTSGEKASSSKVVMVLGKFQKYQKFLCSEWHERGEQLTLETLCSGQRGQGRKGRSTCPSTKTCQGAHLWWFKGNLEPERHCVQSRALGIGTAGSYLAVFQVLSK